MRSGEVGFPREGRRVRESTLGVCEGFCSEGTHCLRLVTCCSRVHQAGAIGVDVSYDDVVILEVEKNVKFWHKI